MHKIFGQKEGAEYFDRQGAYIIPINDGRIAVAKTPKGYFLLGGGIDPDENYEACIKRECLEEIGYDVRIEEMVCSAETYTIHPTIGYFHPIQTYYLGELLEKQRDALESDHQLVWLDFEYAIENMHSKMQSWAIEMAIENLK